MAQEGIISTKNAEILAPTEGMEVRPFDTVKVYATAKAVHVPEGDLMELHPLLADKMIKSGKATKTAPKKA